MKKEMKKKKISREREKQRQRRANIYEQQASTPKEEKAVEPKKH